MQSTNINFGTLLEVVEDWVKQGHEENRILARIIDGKEAVEIPIDSAYHVEKHQIMYLVTRRRNQGNLFDDDGNLVNDPSPKGLLEDLKGLVEQGLEYKTPTEIEIWFDDVDGEIQYRLECHQHYISHNKLILIHHLGKEDEEDEAEFRRMLHEQY